MFIQIGKSQSVRGKDIVGVFDMETATVSPETRGFLKKMQSEMKTVSLCDTEPRLTAMPKAFVLCDNDITDTAYITQLSAETVRKRIEKPFTDR